MRSTGTHPAGGFAGTFQGTSALEGALQSSLKKSTHLNLRDLSFDSDNTDMNEDFSITTERTLRAVTTLREGCILDFSYVEPTLVEESSEFILQSKRKELF